MGPQGPYQVRIDPETRRIWADWCLQHGVIQRVAVAEAMRLYMEVQDAQQAQ